MAEGSVIAMAADADGVDREGVTFMEELHQQAVTWLMGQLNEEESPGVKKYTDVCHFLSCMHDTPVSMESFASALKFLERECVKVLALEEEDNPLTAIPVPPAPGSIARYRVRLWQVGFVEGASVKGVQSRAICLFLLSSNARMVHL